MKKVRAKFLCNSVEDFEFEKRANLMAIYGNEGENKDFTDATPNGSIQISIAKDVPASDFFNPGEEVYVDFVKAE